MIVTINSPSLTRRAFLSTSAAASAASLLPRAHAAAEHNRVRPFSINVPEEALVDLRRRIAATRWPDRETVNDQSQGIQLAKIAGARRYWGTGYDWRKAEAKLNALPQFMTNDRRRGHPLHPRPLAPSERPAADHDAWLAGLGVRAAQDRRPAHRSHGSWRTRGGRFDLVMPSMPGYGFSGKPRAPAGIPTASREPGRS